jgi:putative endonuclease
MEQMIGYSSTMKNTKATGNIGESIAAKYMFKLGYTILDRNYGRKWGELDIVAQQGDVVHFVEVKTVSYETKEALQYAVTHETWRPEELVHAFKFHQLEKIIETWLSEHEYEGEWIIDVVGVRIVPRETFATVNMIENVIRE